MANFAQAEALHTLAALPVPLRVYAGAASLITAWHLHRTSKRLRRVSVALASVPCTGCDQFGSCEESEILENNMRSCLASVDRLLTHVASASYAGWFTRHAARSVAGIAGTLADQVEDYSYIRSGALASAEAAAEADRTSGELRPLQEFLSR